MLLEKDSLRTIIRRRIAEFWPECWSRRKSDALPTAVESALVLPPPHRDPLSVRRQNPGPLNVVTFGQMVPCDGCRTNPGAGRGSYMACPEADCEI